VSKTNRQAKSPIAPPMPQNLDAERSVLGAILLDNKALNSALENLRSEDFLLDQHRRVFTQMISLAESQQAIDLVTLTEQLTRQGQIEKAGGAPYLASLADGRPKVSNVRHYARIVKEKAALRNLIHATHDIQQRAFEGREDAGTILDTAETSIQKLREAAKDTQRDFFDTFEEFEAAAPLSFAIDGFLQNDAITGIAGLSGDGKTWSALAMGRALLFGPARLWDLFPVRERAEKIIYLIPESSRTPFKHRLQKLPGLYDEIRTGRLLVRTLSKGPTPSLTDTRLLRDAKNAHVFVDTAVRFMGEVDESSGTDIAEGLSNDFLDLLRAGARSVVPLFHSPKSFLKERVMSLEGMIRGSSEFGAVLATAWGIKQIDEVANTVHVQNLKPRDFEPCGPFQIIGRPFIDEAGDFRLHKRPGECGTLAEEQPDRNAGGAPPESRQERARRVEMVRAWLATDPNQTAEELRERFKRAGIKVSGSGVKNYRKEALGRGDE
jgi:hypothetical protein